MIKTLERLEQDDINQAPYALWWKELRAEICRLMRSVGCNAVYGYSEELSLTDDGNIQLLCASGTAAVLDVDLTKERDGEGPESTWNAVMPRENLRKESSVLHYPEALGQTPDCKIFHIPSGEYSDHVAPTSAMCGSCRIGHVPDILLTTVEVPDGTPIRGTGTFIQAKVQRKTKALKGESGARELSETLPFVEFELHSQINTKLKLLGLNAVFNLRVDIQCGAETVVACATGTGVFIVALPKSLRPTVSDGRKPGLETVDMQAKLDALMDQQMRQLGLGEEKEGEVKAGKSMRTTRPTMVKKKKAATGSRQYSKSGFVIDLEDDGFEGQSVFSLMDFLPPKDTLLFGSEICPMADRMKSLRSSENVAAGSNRFPGSIVQNICRIWRTSLMNDQDEMIDVAATFRHLLNDVVFRARVYRPCRICGLEFRMQISPGDSLLLLLQGSIVTEPLPLYGVLRGTTEVRRIMRHAGSRAGLSGAEDANETVPVIRILPEDSFTQETAPKDSLHPKPPASMASRCRIHPSPRATPIFSHLSQPQTTQHVEISSLSFVHTGTVKRYVGNLNLVVLRECQTLRENDGLSGFMQRALADFYAIVRSQTVAAGGNAVLSFQLAQVQLADSYNQAQCIMHASGDMVELEEAVSAGSLES
ncbi:C2 domain-containing protein 5 [Hypsibius exemplaris]|uniref:C2 domain-containing protein 5 n=1 Tax=Hypsibius exemplaris TaxID=2072580 RepID=A0A1W0WVH9_HYPEX|nr:C2 domain-containing protein 5 [Hypsibius exemplaris]